MHSKYLISGKDRLDQQPLFKLVGRDEELDNMMKILLRKNASSVLTVGQGGVGCSALALGLQAAKGLATTSFDITHKRIWWLDVVGLFSDPDEATDNFNKIMRTLAATPDKDTILVIEDSRDFIEACNSTGNSSFINLLLSAIERGSFQAIFEVKDSNLEMVLSSHGHMRELFTILEIKEPSKDSLAAIVHSAALSIAAHHGISISDSARAQAIKLTTMYPGKEASLARAQPEAALTLLDRSLATYSKAAHRTPPAKALELLDLFNSTGEQKYKDEFNAVMAAWDQTKSEIDSACKLMGDGELRLSKLEAELSKELEGKDGLANSSPKIDKLKDAISVTKQMISKAAAKYNEITASINADLELEDSHVSTEFAKLSGIPTDKLNEDHGKKLEQLEDNLKNAIFGQDHVVERLTSALLVSQVPGLKQRGKPDAAFMFCGSSGVGKTELVKQLAKQLKDDDGAVIRFDMSEYKEKFMVTSLIGAPPGFQGYGEGGVLTNAVRKNPNAIILFDEIEKAHKDVFDLFLQVLDDGRLTDSMGRVVSFEHTILVFTTNTGASNFLDLDMPYDVQMQNTMDALGEEYRAEFLNRFNGRENIVGFKALSPEIIQRIAKGQLTKMNKDMKDAGVNFSAFMKQEDIARLVADEYKPENGARAIAGIFNTRVYPMFAKTIASTDFNNVSALKARVFYNNGEFTIETETKA